jgi:hypothetical protein
MFWPNASSSDVQVVTMKDSDVHFSAVLLFLPNYIELILGYVGYQAVVMHVFAFSVICDRLD